MSPPRQALFKHPLLRFSTIKSEIRRYRGRRGCISVRHQFRNTDGRAQLMWDDFLHQAPKEISLLKRAVLALHKNLAGREAIYLSSANGNGVTASMKRLCRLPDYHEAAFEILYTPAKHSLKTNDIKLFILLTTKKLHPSKRTLIYGGNCSEKSLKNIYPLRIRENFSVKLKLMRIPPENSSNQTQGY